MLIYVPLLVVASFGGSYVGKKLVGRLSQKAFKKILLAFVAIMGMLLIGEVIVSG